VRTAVDEIAKEGTTPPPVVAAAARVIGIIQLKDIVKGGIRARFGELRQMGIKTVMITGDHPARSCRHRRRVGVDDFLAQATHEAKLKLTRDVQAEGRLVAMTGDGTNDAPALTQAEVAVAMNTGTQAAKEAGNMVDLDSNPTKLIEVVETGKQMLMTRGGADDVQHRQRRRQVLCDHPRRVRDDLSRAERAQHHAPRHAPQRGPVRRHLQTHLSSAP
jgi:K+-transporting ATPase ATPase B chain